MSGSFHTPLLRVPRIAAVATVLAHRFVKATANDGEVTTGAAATDQLMGVSGPDDAAVGEVVSVAKAGVVPVIYGGNVTPGAPLRSDATGRAVVATAGQRHFGYAEEGGDADTLGSIFIAPGIVAA